MNHISYFAIAMSVCSLAGLTSCVDDNYDLSDIDTTVRVPVNDLIIPINIDKIELSSILDLKEDDKIQVVNGVYAATEKGTFTSSAIDIQEIHMAAPHVAPTENDIHMSTSQNSPLKATVSQVSYQLQSDPTSFQFVNNNVSEYIKSVEGIHCDLDIITTLTLPGLTNNVNQFHIYNLQIELPKGLECTNNIGGSYDPKTGILTVSDYTATGNTMQFKLNATYLSAINNNQIVFDEANRTLKFNGEMAVVGGEVIIKASDLKGSTAITDLPASTRFGMAYTFTDITVSTFTGDIEYPLEDVDVSDVMLDNLPDVLTQPETNISLANPQIFLSVTNPLNQYGVTAEAGMTITPVRGTTAGTPCSLDGTGKFTIGDPHNSTGVYNYLLSPTADGAMSMPGYENPTHVAYSSLSNILAGAGIPDKLEISLDNPSLPRQKVTDFRLGNSLGEVVGEYHFVAPLQFNNGSTIVYSDTADGWNDEDLDNVTIQALTINMNVTSELPLGCVLKGYPIDVNGHQINNVEIEGAVIPAKAQNEPLSIRITGEITHLDGIYFEATATADDDTTPLSPDLSITVDNVRPRVSGYYQKEL